MRKINLLVLLVLPMMIFNSCLDESIDSIEVQNNKASDFDYKSGFYHNEGIILLNEYLEENNLIISDLTTDQVIEKMYSQMKDKYPEDFSNLNLAEVKQIFRNYPSMNVYNLKEHWNTLAPNSKLPSELYEIINDAVNNDLSYHEVREMLDNYKGDKEHVAYVRFSTILDSSFELWTNNDLNNGSISNTTFGDNDAAYQTIIADAAVGAITFYCGPLSIIGAGIASLFCVDGC